MHLFTAEIHCVYLTIFYPIKVRSWYFISFRLVGISFIKFVSWNPIAIETTANLSLPLQCSSSSHVAPQSQNASQTFAWEIHLQRNLIQPCTQIIWTRHYHIYTRLSKDSTWTDDFRKKRSFSLWAKSWMYWIFQYFTLFLTFWQFIMLFLEIKIRGPCW